MASNTSSTALTKISNSGYALGETVGTVVLVSVLWLAFFIFLRPKIPWAYSPRSQSKLLSERSRTPALPVGYFNWISSVWKIPDSYILTHESLDSYLFLRFLKLSAVACLLGCPLTWLILLPINATGGNDLGQLDRISTSNIADPARYWAHTICAWLYFGFIMFLITRESIFFINLRQAYLMQPAYTKRLSSRTVLFRAVPDEYLNEARLRRILGGHVVRIWFPTDTKNLQKMVDGLEQIAMHLEDAETKLIRTANEARLKALKKGLASEHENTHATNGAEMESGQSSTDWIAAKNRPTHRDKLFFGKKVDTIDWARAELQKLIPIVKTEQERHRSGEAKKIRAVFVEFDSLGEAQAAYQSLTHHRILTMTPRFTGMHPTDIIWSNLRMRGSEHYIRLAASLAAVLGLIIFWAFPTAVIGAISNIDVASHKYHWLHWINHIPPAVHGFIIGLLPSLLLTLLLALVPIILRYFAIFGGAPSYSSAEATVQNTHFVFQVIQAFLVITIGSATSVLVAFTNVGSWPSRLAQGLPRASTFFINYTILQGFGVFASILVGLSGVVITPLLARILGSSPRKVFLRWNQMAGVGWGTVYPKYTILFVIAISYSCLSPIILLFSAVSLLLLYCAHRYNVLFVYDTGVDMKGSAYPTALQHLFVGLYIAELCLIGLFATQLGNARVSGPFALMIILVVFTALYHAALNASLTPLIKYLPKTLEAEERDAQLEQPPTDDVTEAIPPPVEGTTATIADDEKPAEPDKHGATATTTNVASVDSRPSTASAARTPSTLARFFKPHVYDDYAAMRRVVPTLDLPADSEADEGLVRDAYLPPAVWAEVPHLLIPRDEMGISAVECGETGRVVPCSDEVATLDGKNRIVVDEQKMQEILLAEKESRIKEY